jgi:predicted MPP superfamily phosphohydrolase
MSLAVSVLMVPAVMYLTLRFYSVARLILGFESWKRAIIPAVFWSFYLFPITALIYYFVVGDIDVLRFPKLLTYWFWFGLVFVYLLATWVILADVIKWVIHLFSNSKSLVDRLHAWTLLLCCVLLFGFTAWKVYNNTTEISTRSVNLHIENLPPELEGFKIVHISDIQGDEYTGPLKIARYIRKVNQLHPDLIVFTGDLISYGTDYIEMSARELGKAKATYGTVAVVGDHDYWAGVENVVQALNRKGIPVIQDENHCVNIDSLNSILITGVTEVYSKKVAPAVVDSLTKNSGSPAVKIFASHQISEHLVKDAESHGYDLFLAGHTHGGQVRVPFMGMTFSASDLETDFISGVYHAGNLLLNVNNGLGFTLAPIRYNALADISVIRLKSE